MKNIFSIIQAVLAVLLMVAILLQQRGSGLGSAFGGGGNVYSTRRGADKTIFQITIGIAILFFALAIVNLVL